VFINGPNDYIPDWTEDNITNDYLDHRGNDGEEEFDPNKHPDEDEVRDREFDQ
jgi:hypothetical protein